jgi:hypothetical protein
MRLLHTGQRAPFGVAAMFEALAWPGIAGIVLFPIKNVKSP